MPSLIFAFFIPFCVIDAPAAERPSIHPSDVVFMYSPRDVTQLETYQGTIVGWGGRADSRDAKEVDSYLRHIEDIHKRGLKFCASVDFLVDFRGFIDFRPDTFMNAVCRDLDGNPIRVPWLWDHNYKGNPAYWWCTNHPDYRAFLRDQTERACLASIDGLHLDDYSGTSACSSYAGGCFCEYCRKGFKEYLQKNFSGERLKPLGIDSLEKFDYGAYLKSRGLNAEQYKKNRSSVSLIDLFQDFQNECMKQRITEIFEYAEQLSKKPLLRSVNSSASSPRELLPVPIIDYFCGEVPHHAPNGRVPVEPVFVFRLAEVLGRRQTATASGQDWAWIKANEKPGLVRTWIAQAYVFGNVFMVPHNQWCFTEKLGTHWWQGKPEDFAYLYQFVRKHQSLLDGYTPLADTAVVYSPSRHGPSRDAIVQLTRANVPFGLIFQADDDKGFTSKTIPHEPYSTIIIPDKTNADHSYKNYEKTGAKVISWNGISSLPEEIKQELVVKGSEQVRVTLRGNQNQPDSPIICHVLNQDYDVAGDQVRPAMVQISIRNLLLNAKLNGLKIQSAILHQPQHESVPIPVHKEENGLSFQINSLDLWAIVELKTAKAQ